MPVAFTLNDVMQVLDDFPADALYDILLRSKLQFHSTVHTHSFDFVDDFFLPNKSSQWITKKQMLNM
jgi:hypothetical protein